MVKRYWCDHCNKGSLSSHAMAKHEKHCTLNPARACRVCALAGEVQPEPHELAAMVALFPPGPISHYEDEAGRNDYYFAVNAAMPKVRELAENCPACILAAIRQAGVPAYLPEGFDFKAEMRGIFDSIEPEQGYDY